MEESNPLVGLDAVDWSSLKHAYGPATDVPDTLRRLASPSLTEDDLRSIYYDLYGNIYHQGSRYSASVAAVPFLIALLDASATVCRERILQLLVRLAISNPDSMMRGFDISGLRERTVSVQAPTFAEDLQRQREEWVDAAGDNENERSRRQLRLELMGKVDQVIEETLIDLQVYEAVKAGLPSYRRCLASASATVRAWSAYALAWFPEDFEASQQALFALVEREQDSAVRGTALLSLGLLQAPLALAATPTSKDTDLSETPIGKLLSQLFEQDDSDNFTRFCCALGLAVMLLTKSEHVAQILRKVTDNTYLKEYEPNDLGDDTAFPHANTNLTALASSALASLKGSAYPDVPLALAAALPAARGEATLVLTTMALRTAFDAKPPAASGQDLPPFDTLTDPQQAVVRALTQVDSFNWMFINYTEILRAWGLPSELTGLQAYAGLAPPVPPVDAATAALIEMRHRQIFGYDELV
ncbi:hypothetical protein GGX14DRAFT_538664 [Mycena pura]|uniref:Uncharacterized protein n=1 Tax=Mycena pura TaxID=153505 RepID=A0AAD7E533_9AGAR|nr:hypothetical protein GGX14DRAFT_538664 [Mycena pura]